MNPTEHSWQQELAAIEAEIDSLKQRRELQQAELRRLQESGYPLKAGQFTSFTLATENVRRARSGAIG